MIFAESQKAACSHWVLRQSAKATSSNGNNQGSHFVSHSFQFQRKSNLPPPKKKKLRKLRLIYTFMCENVSSLSNLCTQRHLNAFSFFFQANRFGWSQYLCSLSLFGAAVSLWVREMRCNGCKSQGLMVLETGGHHTTIQFMWAWAIVSKIDKLWS